MRAAGLDVTLPAMTGPAFHTLFDSPFGTCGIAWWERGIVSLELPGVDRQELLFRLSRRAPGSLLATPPPAIQEAIDGVVALLGGSPPDLRSAPLDLDRLPPFHQRVYAHAREIPPGSTVTYGELARRLGAPGAARAVGQALARNPFSILVPCHRVLSAAGKMCGFSAHGGVATKERLLELEGYVRGGQLRLA